MIDFVEARRNMVAQQLAARGIRDPGVLAAMGKVPREAFVDASQQGAAYEDRPLPIDDGQTISQPYIVAVMIAAAEVRPGAKVLDIGTGSGYAAAVLAEMGARVFTIERHSGLAETASERLAALGYGIEVRTGDGTLGWPEEAPFDAVIAAAGGPRIPQSLKDQLTIGGGLVMPVGETTQFQKLLKLTRRGAAEFEETPLADVRFVALIGAEGWQTDERTPFSLPRL